MDRPQARGLLCNCLRRLFHHHMSVRAYEPKRTDASNTSLPVAYPRRQPGGNRSMTGGERYMRIDLLQMQMRRNFFVLQGENHLDQSGSARRGFQMSDIRLYGT